MAALKVGFPTLMVGQWKGWDSHRNSGNDKKSAKQICHPAVDPLLNCALPYNFEHCTKKTELVALILFELFIWGGRKERVSTRVQTNVSGCPLLVVFHQGSLSPFSPHCIVCR